MAKPVENPNEQRDLIEIVEGLRSSGLAIGRLDPVLGEAYRLMANALSGAVSFGQAVVCLDRLARRIASLAEQTATAHAALMDFSDPLDIPAIARRNALLVKAERYDRLAQLIGGRVPVMRAMRSQRQPMQTR